METKEILVLAAVLVGLTLLLGIWGFIGGLVVAVLVATGQIKTGFNSEGKLTKISMESNKNKSGENINKGIGLGFGSCIGVIIFIIVLGVIGSFISSSTSGGKTSTTMSDNVPTAETKEVKKPEGKVEVKSDTLKTLYGYKHIVGEVVNNTAGDVTFVQVTATYYDKEGKVTGTSFTYAGTADTPMAVSATAPFDIASLDTSLVVDHYKLDVTWN